MNAILPDKLSEEISQKLKSFFKKAKEAGIELPASASFNEDLELSFIASDFIFKNLYKNPHLLMYIIADEKAGREYDFKYYNEKLASMLIYADNEISLSKTLREFRNKEMLRIAFGDINSKFDLFETMRQLSALAKACLDNTIKLLHRWFCVKYGKPIGESGKNQHLVVIGMGKLGGDELNFSSDIDLIFAYPEEGETKGDNTPITNQEFFSKLCMKLIQTLNEITNDGFVFRVDMRLRPYGENGPIVMSFDAIENYYQNQGREWERYALIKANIAAGDKEKGDELLYRLKPFIYRKYLNYGSIESLRNMKEMINAEITKRGMEDDIKLGKGGIREIEFFGQIFQLIRGGIVTQLQEKSICKALNTLYDNKYITKKVCENLIESYIFLRNVEHRLQEFLDSRTHTIPTEPLQQIRLAYSMGFLDVKNFNTALCEHLDRVHSHFSTLLNPEEDDKATKFDSNENALKRIWENISCIDKDKSEYAAILESIGFKKTDEIAALLQNLKNDKGIETLSDEGERKLEKLIPKILIKSLELNASHNTLKRIFDFIRTILKRSCYLSLFLENKKVLTHLIKLADASSWIISLLTKYPLLLDELIDPRTLYSPPNKKELKKELAIRIARFEYDDIESQMDEMRVFKQVNLLRVAAADITDSEALSIKKTSEKLTEIAETILDKTINISWSQLEKKNGIPICVINGEKCDRGFAVIAYGKLGSVELSYGSDLDMVFLHAGINGMTQGDNPIDNSTFFARLGQRVLQFLSSRTSLGILYETDMRLRPSGSSGLLVSHIEAFKDYQENKAWTWEHQSLVRARAIGGNALLCTKFNEIRKNVLTKPRIKEDLVKDIIDMRNRLREERMYKGNEGLFDLKHGIGGIIDIEFIVQYLVLLHSCNYPKLASHTSNVMCLKNIKAFGILKSDTTDLLIEAYETYRALLHRLNLAEKKLVLQNDSLSELRERVVAVWESFFV